MTIPRDALIAEAERIGRRLMQAAVREDGLLSWWTFTGAGRTRSESIYSGAAGIALFFMRLAEATGNDEYLGAATSAMRWTESPLRRGAALPHGFYNGRLGIAYAWLRLSSIDGRSRQAVLRDLTRDALAARDSHTADLLGGVAGTLLGLLHVHTATGEPSLLDMASELAGELIARARPARIGLYWDRSPQQVRGLCGLSHGAAGVGWVLSELANYIANDAFAELARQAFAYERDHFDAATGNWTDYRCTYQRPADFARLEAAYLAGNLAPFYERRDMNAWCHGAAGIGLTRLRAWELFGDDADREDLHRAVRRVTADFDGGPAMPSATLCHGTCGNAALLFAAAPVIGFADCDAIVHRVVSEAIESARRTGHYPSGDPADRSEDASLLMGTSGIGTFLLQLAAGDRRDPLLLPSLSSARPQTGRGVLAMTSAEIHGAIAARHFPRMHALGGDAAMDDRSSMFAAARRRHPRAADALALEETRWALAENASLALLGIRGIVHGQRADELLQSAPLRLSDDAAIVTLQEDGGDVLLFATVDSAAEVALQPLASAILGEFRRPHRAAEVIDRLTGQIDAAPAEVRSAAAAQIRTALLQSILVPA